MKLKGSNGVVFDVDKQVAYGLIDAGHAVAAGDDTDGLAPLLGHDQGAEYRHQVAAGGVQPIHADQTPAGDAEESDAHDPENTQGDAEGTPSTSDGDDGADQDGKPEQPAGNATTDAWREYALKVGCTEDEIEGLKRDELRDYVLNR